VDAIDISEIATWPTDLLAAVENAKPDLVDWAKRKREIDRLGEKDVRARIHPPPNEHQDSADKHTARFDDVLSEHLFVVRHCTRLCDVDIERIAKTGMLPLTPEMTKLRLAEIQERGYLSADDASALERKSLSNESERQNSTFWILGQAPLREEDNVGRLFSHWGGEAIYLAHEEEPLGAVLRSLGAAAIVEACVPHAMLRVEQALFNSIGEALRYSVAYGSTPEFELEVTTTETVQPDQIRNIFRQGTDDFEALTGAKNWVTNLSAPS
jgi:hypothetical protein